MNVVVSRYKKNVDFVNRFNEVHPVNILIYDKETPENPLNIPVNKGQEASVYLKYIVDYYDELPEFTFFIHDDEFTWHHTGSIVDKFREAVDALSKRGEVSRWDDAHCFGGECTKQLYYNVNDKCHWDKPNLIAPNYYNILLQWYFEYVEEYIPFAKIPHNDDLIYDHRGSAQFLVHRDLIRGLPKRFYERLYNWIIATDLDNYVTSRLLEWTWHVFWVIYPAMDMDAR